MLEISFKVSGKNPALIAAVGKVIALAVEADNENAAPAPDSPKEAVKTDTEATLKETKVKPATGRKTSKTNKVKKSEPEPENEDAIFDIAVDDNDSSDDDSDSDSMFDISDDSEDDSDNSDDGELDTDDPDHMAKLHALIQEVFDANKNNKKKASDFLSKKLKATSVNKLDAKGKKTFYAELKKMLG